MTQADLIPEGEQIADNAKCSEAVLSCEEITLNALSHNGLRPVTGPEEITPIADPMPPFRYQETSDASYVWRPTSDAGSQTIPAQPSREAVEAIIAAAEIDFDPIEMRGYISNASEITDAVLSLLGKEG